MAVPTADSTPRTDSESAGLRWTSAGVRQIEVRGEHRRTSRGEHRRTIRQVMSAADTGGDKPADKLADTNRRTESESAADNFVSASVHGGLRLGEHWRTPADVRRSPNLSAVDNRAPWVLPQKYTNFRMLSIVCWVFVHITKLYEHSIYQILKYDLLTPRLDKTWSQKFLHLTPTPFILKIIWNRYVYFSICCHTKKKEYSLTVYAIPLSSLDSRSQHADDNYPLSENTIAMMTSVHVTVTLSAIYHLQTAYSSES